MEKSIENVVCQFQNAMQHIRSEPILHVKQSARVERAELLRRVLEAVSPESVLISSSDPRCCSSVLKIVNQPTNWKRPSVCLNGFAGLMSHYVYSEHF